MSNGTTSKARFGSRLGTLRARMDAALTTHWKPLTQLAQEAGYTRRSKGSYLKRLVERGVVEMREGPYGKEFRLKEGWEKLVDPTGL